MAQMLSCNPRDGSPGYESTLVALLHFFFLLALRQLLSPATVFPVSPAWIWTCISEPPPLLLIDPLGITANMGGFYMQYLESLCRRRGWNDPSYECYRDHSGYTCLVLVNGREYQTDLAYQSDSLAQENAAMRAFMVCRNFSVNGGMLARNGIVQGLPATEPARRSKKSRYTSSSHSSRDSHRRSGHHSSSSSTASFD
ncbi:uncharacterized protein CLUP02_00225 [Colletotrichum lupini]|uniref:Uncharacterized protein n=1 Tax=Colletotrichum lupini TaxID=145971 RepID=A0A9Q8W8S0_9PEZI|nr:uncharacterized protein CLUP02_00225 [Colletotrichum lupini]UQC73580.1 hypothetical protein CLUP02_00225 [Colletotrichum lupini]